MFRFQKLEIYNLAKDIVKDHYKLVKSFPSEERFALVQQMNRAAVSIPSNIALKEQVEEAIKKKHISSV